MADEYVYGHYGDCQDGCKKFHVTGEKHCPGGAANAANSIRHWNVEVGLFTLPGQMPRKRRFVVNGQLVFRADSEKHAYDLSDYKAELSRSNLLAAVKEFGPDAILLSDYDKGTLSQGLVTDLTVYAYEKHLPIVADAKREPLFYSATVLKCNGYYARRFQPARVAGNLAGLVVTHGELPPRMPAIGSACQEWPELPRRTCVNHVGAGDCFAAHLLLGLAHGLSLNQSARVAHSAGRVYVGAEHNRAPLPEEIRADLEGGQS